METSRRKAYLTALPAAAAGTLLFAANAAALLLSAVLVSAGLLTACAGGIYLLGLLTVATDLSAPALIFCGFFCVFAGLALFFAFLRLAALSLRLFRAYAAFFRGEAAGKPFYLWKGKGLLWLFLAFAAVSLAAAVFFQQSSGTTGSVIRETLEFDNAKYITVSTTNMDFEIRPWSGDKIKLEYVNDTPMIVRQTDVNYLKLTQDDSFTLSLFTKDVFSYKMTLWLPENDYREMYLTSSSGSITLLETQSEYTEISTRSGAISVDEATEKLKITTYTGNVRLRYIAFANAGTINNNSGKTEVVMPDFSGVKLDFKTVTGFLTSDMFESPVEREQGSAFHERVAALSRYLYVTTEDGDLILRKE